jgi:lipopolysaccharide/colanic/teichoic acid biosynthesis glycosyltransferase
MTSRDAHDATVECSAVPSYLWLKARIDWYVALAALVALAPVLLVVAILVRRDGYPAVFRQVRAGLRGRPFTLLKFRTMRPEVDPYGDSPQHGGDSRLTKFGQWLRETSLDELPQIINVLRGEMSLVGPRPLYVQQMAEWNARQRCRLLVKPGLTGFAQVQGRGSLTIEEKLELDVQYVQRISLRTDWGIVWQTVRGLWTSGGIYEVRYSAAQERRSLGA